MIQRQDLLQKLIASLIFLLPVAMGTIPSAASAINILLLLLAIFWAWPDWRCLSRSEKILCLSMIAFFVVALLSFLNSEDISKSWARLERLLRVLAFVPIFLLFKKLDFNLLRPLTLGMLIAGPVLLVSAQLTMLPGSAQGAYNSILFGDFSAVVAVFLLCYFLVRKDNWYLKLASAVSFGCAAQAMILSGTRGAWAALLICGALALGFFFYHSIKQNAFKKLFIALTLTGIAATLTLQNPLVESRTLSAVDEFKGYVTDTNPHTSLGLRFQMWEAAGKIWLKNPLIGSGLGDYSIDLANMMKSGESEIAEHFGEAHSIFFEFLATTGLFGFLSLLFALFLHPIWLLRPGRITINDDLFISICGLMIVVAFLVFGFTQNWLGRSSITSVYMVLIAIFLSSKCRRLTSPAINQKHAL